MPESAANQWNVPPGLSPGAKNTIKSAARQATWLEQLRFAALAGDDESAGATDASLRVQVDWFVSPANYADAKLPSMKASRIFRELLACKSAARASKIPLRIPDGSIAKFNGGANGA
jgi:hypothetical protein